MRTSYGVGHLCLLVMAAALSGCAGWRETLNPSPTVTQTREERAADAVKEFEDRRDAAQLAAAIERIEQGDMPRGETMLESIVKRRPTCIPARLRLAEVLWMRNDMAAESHLRAALEADASHAEAHHALGLLLDATGRTDEARRHFTRATQIEPENEVYRVTADSLPGEAATGVLVSQSR
jgi:Tfp pilus assembly protein PilF